MSKATDIVAYTFQAEQYCPEHIIGALPTGEGEPFDGWALAEGAAPMSAEENLNELAAAFGIDRMDEHSFDSGDFPKVVFDSQVEGVEWCAAGHPIGLAVNPHAEGSEQWHAWARGYDYAMAHPDYENPLSGEWADQMTPRELYAQLSAQLGYELGDGAYDEVVDAFELGYATYVAGWRI
jgi:hypothetical protein